MSIESGDPIDMGNPNSAFGKADKHKNVSKRSELKERAKELGIHFSGPTSNMAVIIGKAEKEAASMEKMIAATLAKSAVRNLPVPQAAPKVEVVNIPVIEIPRTVFNPNPVPANVAVEGSGIKFYVYNSDTGKVGTMLINVLRGFKPL